MNSIYILDFDADITYVLCNWFESEGYEVKGFITIEQLFKQLTISHPDCIILDCMYGRLSLTINACNAIQQSFHYKGKLLLTSTSNLTTKDLKQCNASDFIAKPFDLSEVLKVVDALLINSSVKTIINQ